VAIMSYNGAINFGLLGDFDALPDIESIGEALTAELALLVALAIESRTQAAAGATAGAAAPATAPAATGELTTAVEPGVPTAPRRSGPGRRRRADAPKP
jgi:diacylglycerol O-acyltransferase